MRTRMRAMIFGCFGVLLLVCAVAAGTPAQAVGTGSCDPFDVACLKQNNLYGADICAPNSTTCLTNYQALGVAVCTPGNAACAAMYASIIGGGSGAGAGGTVSSVGPGTPPSGVPISVGAGGVAVGDAPIQPYQSGGFAGNSNLPVFSISTPTPVVARSFGTVPSTGSTVTAGQYGINICASDDTNCLVAQQSRGIPICPPDDNNCRIQYASIFSVIPTYVPTVNATAQPIGERTPIVGQGIPRYVVGGTDTSSGSGGSITVYRK